MSSALTSGTLCNAALFKLVKVFQYLREPSFTFDGMGTQLNCTLTREGSV